MHTLDKSRGHGSGKQGGFKAPVEIQFPSELKKFLGGSSDTEQRSPRKQPLKGRATTEFQRRSASALDSDSDREKPKKSSNSSGSKRSNNSDPLVSPRYSNRPVSASATSTTKKSASAVERERDEPPRTMINNLVSPRHSVSSKNNNNSTAKAGVHDAGSDGPSGEDVELVSERVAKLMEQCEKSGKLYSDPDFPPGPTSLYKDPNNPPGKLKDYLKSAHVGVDFYALIGSL